ncbi:MAG: hypothetical protein R8K20_05715 [Gallionellaceae bacterium]
MSKNIVTFMIGFFASLCAVFVPRMLAALNGNDGKINYFGQDYMLIGIVFAVVIGFITVIFEQGKTRKASETFMTALGIPALLAGALNTGVVGGDVSDLQARNQRLNDSLVQQSGIVIEENASDFAPLEIEPLSLISPPSFSLISVAHAADNVSVSKKNEGFNLGVQMEQRQYRIVLKKFNNKDDAIKSAEELRRVIPNVVAVKAGGRFLVIEGGEPLNKSDALLKAIEFQKKTGLKPSLVPVK